MSKDQIIYTIKTCLTLNKMSRMSISDVATHTGLSHLEAEQGLYTLLQEFHGNLTVTTEGDLLFEFPFKFKKSSTKINSMFFKFTNNIQSLLINFYKFIIKTWLSIILVFYFITLIGIISIVQSNQNKSRDDSTSTNSLLPNIIINFIHELIYWNLTFSNKPFYKKINNFFLGPTTPKEDPLILKKNLLHFIRQNHGYIGTLEAMNITQITNPTEAENLLLSLVITHEGHIETGNHGEIIYYFPQYTTTNQLTLKNTHPINRITIPRCFDNNKTNDNLLAFFLNFFNLSLSLYLIIHPIISPKFIILFGWIPFILSCFLLVTPIARLIRHKKKTNKIKTKIGLYALISFMSQSSQYHFTEDTLKKIWYKQTGEPVSTNNLIRNINKINGDLEIDPITGEHWYKFDKFKNEILLLNQKRHTKI